VRFGLKFVLTTLRLHSIPSLLLLLPPSISKHHLTVRTLINMLRTMKLFSATSGRVDRLLLLSFLPAPLDRLRSSFRSSSSRGDRLLLLPSLLQSLPLPPLDRLRTFLCSSSLGDRLLLILSLPQTLTPAHMPSSFCSSRGYHLLLLSSLQSRAPAPLDRLPNFLCGVGGHGKRLLLTFPALHSLRILERSPLCLMLNGH